VTAPLAPRRGRNRAHRHVAAIVAACSLAAAAAYAAGLDPDALLKPLADSWPTYSGDYSGRRFSALKQVTRSNVQHLSLAWTARLQAGPRPSFAGNAAPGAPQTFVGGEGTGDIAAPGGNTIRGAILAVDDVLYVSTPDNAWAFDARDGRELWHYFWKTRGGTHIGNRGMGMWGRSLYVETPDNYLVSLDARTGRERWHKEIASFSQQYFSTTAPIVVGNHVIVGTGNDLDAPGFLQSFDPETGELQWKYYAVPMNPGDPGLETWKDLDAARHGGGQMWLPGSYDPQTRLYIVGTGNPTPAYTSQSRGEGDNLFTCSLVAINIETGKMAWHYQTSPHDTHDWDSAQTPVFVDGAFGGRPRKLVITASRNGYFFVLDRTTGEHLLTSRFADSVNWAKGLNHQGQPTRDPAKDYHVGGSLVSSANGGATNWPPTAFSPDTGFLYVPSVESYAMYYLTETDPRGAMGLGGKDEVAVATLASSLLAIDYRTGRTAWKHTFTTMLDNPRGGPGLLATGGGLVFGGDISGNFIAFDAATGKILWHSRIGNVSNAPETYLVDGRQHVLVAAGDTMFAFALN